MFLLRRISTTLRLSGSGRTVILVDLVSVLPWPSATYKTNLHNVARKLEDNESVGPTALAGQNRFNF